MACAGCNGCLEMGAQKKNGKLSAGHHSHKIRIVGGQWKRTPLVVADVEGLRPTSDRVRETVFNWLTHMRGARFANMHCLDLFSGTGALGFEAASRGMAHVTMIEKNRVAYEQLQRARNKLQASQIAVFQADAMDMAAQLIRQGKTFDLIFLDPPFRKEWLPKVIPLCVELLAKDGMVYIESDMQLTAERLALWSGRDVSALQLVRDGQAGQVYYHLFEMQASCLS